MYEMQSYISSQFSSIASESALKKIKTITTAEAALGTLFSHSDARAYPCGAGKMAAIPLLLRRQIPSAICTAISWVMWRGQGEELVLLTQSVSRRFQDLPESPEAISDSHKAQVILF